MTRWNSLQRRVDARLEDTQVQDIYLYPPHSTGGGRHLVGGELCTCITVGEGVGGGVKDTQVLGTYLSPHCTGGGRHLAGDELCTCYLPPLYHRGGGGGHAGARHIPVYSQYG